MIGHSLYNALFGRRTRATCEWDSKSIGFLEDATDALGTNSIFLTLIYSEKIL
jgi:hypothetical protein